MDMNLLHSIATKKRPVGPVGAPGCSALESTVPNVRGCRALLSLALLYV